MVNDTLGITVKNGDILKVEVKKEIVNVSLDRVVATWYGASGAYANTVTKSYIANTNIGIHRAVALNNEGKLIVADNTDLSTLNKVIGVSLQSVLTDTPCEVLVLGELTDQSFNFNGSVVYVGSGGILTTTPPSSGYILQMGTVVNPTTVYIEKQMPIKLI